MNKVVLAYAADAAPAAQTIRAWLEPEPVEVSHALNPLPQPWDAVVVLFLMSPQALQDADLIRFAAAAAQAELPLVPVVDDLRTYDFRQVPRSLQALSERNAVGLQPDDGASIVQAVRGYLGLEAFAREKRVFISYRRSDGKAQAETIHDHLWQDRFVAFLDTFSIEAGAPVQDRIMREIVDKDLILLIESPDAAASPWVRDEIFEAGRQRIPVCAVSLDPKVPPMDFVRDIPRIAWDPTDPHNLERVKLLVARNIAARSSLDRRVQRSLRTLARLHKLTVKEVEPRRVLLRQGKRGVLIDYEDAAVSLERLHRLYQGSRRLKPGGAIFICGDRPVLEPTHEAVAWARGRSRLHVMPLADMAKELHQLFQAGRRPRRAAP